ncbi:MAG: molecular chaperone HtpG [Pseudomonadota bacterium]|nr:molecular chaperone HtpG [Pseudomonadota bacterium]
MPTKSKKAKKTKTVKAPKNAKKAKTVKAPKKAKKLNKQALEFRAEVKQLLHLMIHSLYSNKEIFLRELISNASDAADKLRFEAISDQDLLENNPDLEIRVDFDKKAGTISITDNGIGMSRDDVVEQLGTIARSGTAEFMNQLTGDQRKDAALIGEFGVGFYSSFIVADRVEVFSRRAGLPSTEGVHWESGGEGEFTVEPIEIANRGTRVLLHLRKEERDFADPYRLRTLIRKFSDHIAFPVKMPVEQTAEEKEGKGQVKQDQEETVNAAMALWARPRTEISNDEYKEFYKHISHDFHDPIVWGHNKVEGKREYTSLIYVPPKAPFDLWNREAPKGLKLYVQRVFIMDDADQFLPLYLRFVRGVIDTNDLSLNVSRELLQQDSNVEAIRTALTKRVLDMLSKLAKDEPGKYQSFWDEFGRVLKEGSAEDLANREKLAKLLRFSTTYTDSENQDQSLEDYIGRKADAQDKIYYIAADGFNAAKSSPHLEIFRKKGIEVLLFSDAIDEWFVGHLGEFEELQLRDVTRGELDLPDLDGGDSDNNKDQKVEEHKELLERLEKELNGKVKEVRVTSRLTDSPACLVLGEFDMGTQMRRLMEASGQTVPPSLPIFELNPDHPLICRLADESDDQRFKDLARVLFDQASLAEGRQPEDPGAFVQRLNRLLLDLSA